MLIKFFDAENKSSFYQWLKKLEKHRFYKKELKSLSQKATPLGKLSSLSMLSRKEIDKILVNDKKISYVMRMRNQVSSEMVNIPLSKKDFEGLIIFEKDKFEKIGVNSQDIASVIFFPLQHVIPMSLALQRLGAIYIPFEGDEEKVFFDVINNKISFLVTTPSRVSKLIDFVKKTKLKSSLRLINTGGQKIKDYHFFKMKVKKYLGADLVDNIGSSELQNFAIHCREHEQYHFVSKDQIVEVIDPETKSISDKGELVITPLWRKDFPLVRYKTRDIVKLIKSKKCSCGFADPRVIKGIEGRLDQMIKLNGVLLPIYQIHQKLLKLWTEQIVILDNLIWKYRDSPKLCLVVQEKRRKDELFIFITKKRSAFFRRKNLLVKFCQKEFYLTPEVRVIEYNVFNKLFLESMLIDLRLKVNKMVNQKAIKKLINV